MATKIVAILVLFAFTTTFGYRRRHHNAGKEVDMVDETIADTIKAIDSGVTEGNGEQLRLQVTLNNWILYWQENLYLVHASLNNFQDETVKNFAIWATKIYQKIGYNIAKNANANSTQIKHALKAELQNFIDNATKNGRKMFAKVEGEQLQFGLSTLRNGFDWALFHFYYINIEIKNRIKSNQEISNKLKTTAKELYDVLEDTKSKNLTKSNEVLVILDFVSDISKFVLRKVDRFVYLYTKEQVQVKIITDTSKAMRKLTEDLKRNSQASTNTLQLLNGIEEYFHSSHSAINKLVDLSNGTLQYIQEIAKDIQIQQLSLILTVKALLQLIN